MHIMQIDVEPWYCDLNQSRWGNYEENVAKYTREILSMLEETNNKATFFVLTEVAEQHPELVTEIEDRGHEVGSHGTRHTHVSELNAEAFVDSLTTSIDALRAAGADQIVGYRAPQFSLDSESRFVIPELIERNFLYDSSVFPAWTPLYGIPDAPRTPYRISESTLHRDDDSQLWEIPLSTYRVPGLNRNVPVAGGFYLRALPYRLLRRLLMMSSASPEVCYIHPWELNTSPKRVPEYPWFQYFRRSTTRAKLRALFSDFSFTTTREYVNGNLAGD